MTTNPAGNSSAIDAVLAASNNPKSDAAPDPTSANSDLVSKNMFLQLLVAQLKNQNPLDPADGVQFVTQLAQFTTLEQSSQMRSDLSAIREILTQTAAGAETS